MRSSWQRTGGRWLWLVALLGVLAVAPAATFYTLATNGPASNRLCIVFLSEGYTSAQTNQFLTDCTNALNSYFSGGAYPGEEPFIEYSNYFNAYAVFTNSSQPGSDHPIYPTTANTAFNSTYDTNYNYVITIPAGATGQGLVDGFITNSATPWATAKYRLPVLLVNEPFAEGGSGGSTAIASTGGNFQGILTHESAHVLAGLGDEYEASPTGFDFTALPSEPNTTTNTAFNSIPWKLWIDTNSTPLPTPNDPLYFDNVGLFQGAHYSTTNWYRPRLNCRMRSVSTGPTFCEVCREALVKMFYSKVRAIDAGAPTNASLTLASNQPVIFSVSILQPTTHALTVQWQTNGVNLPGATNNSYGFDPASFTNGTYVLRALVRDDTAWVRNDPGNLLRATNSWNVTVALPRLWLESPQMLPNGQFRFTVRGSNVTNFTVRASTNLTTWTSLSTNALAGGIFNFTNSAPANLPQRFYRAVTPPQ